MELITAAADGDLSTLKQKLAEGVDIHYRDIFGRTALHLAVRGGHTDCVEVLMAAGVQLNTEDKSGDTALHRAITKSHTDCVEALLNGGAQTDKEAMNRVNYIVDGEKQKEILELLADATQSEDKTSRKLRVTRKQEQHVESYRNPAPKSPAVSPSYRQLADQEHQPNYQSPPQEISSVTRVKNAKIKLKGISLNERQHVVRPQQLSYPSEAGDSIGIPKDTRMETKAVSPKDRDLRVRPKDQGQTVRSEAESQLAKPEYNRVKLNTSSPSDKYLATTPRAPKQSTPLDAQQSFVTAKDTRISVFDSMGAQKPEKSAEDAPVLPIDIEPLNVKDLKIDRYNRLGQGNYGFVYKAELKGSIVAVKELGIPKKKKYEISKAVINEVEVSATVRHPNIVLFLGHCFESLNDIYYLLLVYEFVDGRNLDQIICDDELKEQFSFNMPTRYQALLQTTQALAYLHAQRPQIIHGDIKPANIMLTKEGTVKLCDLGLSKVKQQSAMSMASTLAPRGTPVYMAPEQLIHQRTSSTMTDVYAFGALMYETLFEKYMWDIDQTWDVDKLKTIMKTELIPQTLQNIKNHPAFVAIRKCIEFEPTERPASLLLVKDLKELCENSC